MTPGDLPVFGNIVNPKGWGHLVRNGGDSFVRNSETREILIKEHKEDLKNKIKVQVYKLDRP